MKKNLFVCLLLWHLAGFNSITKAGIPDELQIKLTHAKSDTERVRHLTYAAENIRHKDLALAKAYTKQAFDLSRKTGFARGLAAVYLQEGENYEMEQDYNKAMGSFLQSAKIDDSIHDELQVASAYLRMAEVFDFQHNTVQAFKYYRLALEGYQKFKDTANMASVYIDMANDFSSSNQLDSSLKLLNNALAISNNDDNRGEVLGSIGSTYSGMGKHKEAIEYYQKALTLFIKTGNDFGAAVSYNNLAESEYNIGAYDVAEKDALKGLDIFKKANLNVEVRNFYGILAEVYEAKKDFKNATYWYKTLNNTSDSIYNNQTAKLNAEMEAQYQNAKKEKAIAELQVKENAKTAELKRQQIIIISSVAIIVLILSGATLLYFNFKKISRLNRELEELNAIKNKLFSIISHDLRTPLGSLRNMSVLLKTGSVSQERIAELSNRMDVTLEKTMHLMDNLLHWATIQIKGRHMREEVLALAEITGEVLNFVSQEAETKKITVQDDIGVDHKVLADENMLLLVMRNLLTNALKFTDDGGMIRVSSELSNGRVHVSVTDNGVGMDEATLIAIRDEKVGVSNKGTGQEKGYGLGLQLCKEYARKWGDELRIESKPGEGSRFSFSLVAA